MIFAFSTIKKKLTGKFKPVKLFFASWTKNYFSYYSVILPLDTESKIQTRLATPGFDIYQNFI